MTDTEVVFDPGTYVNGVPFDALARLRRDSPVSGSTRRRCSLPGGPGFWLVLRHADVETVLTSRSCSPRPGRDPGPGSGDPRRSATSGG